MLLVDSTPWLGCRFRGGVLDVFGNVLGWSSPHIFDTYIYINVIITNNVIIRS